MKKPQQNAEEKKSILVTKIVGVILLSVLAFPLVVIKLLRHCNLFPEAWECSGETLFQSPVAILIAAAAAIALFIFAYLLFRGDSE